jgi:putative colanic acid biosynthesis UDP-glucose lipid carrier transferase
VIVLAFIGVFRSIDISVFVTLRYLLILFLVIASTKFLSYYVLVVGYGDVTIELIEIFKSKKELGYNIKGISNDSKQARSLIKTINDCYAFLKNDRNIDEIYCAIDELKDFEITHFIQFAEKNRYIIKFIPNTSKIITKRLKTDYYNYLPVLSLQEVSLNSAFNKVIKQIFDVLFALAVIIFVISWLSVVLFILMKIESKGPLFYRHKRHGISYKEFYCFKYRSLNITKEVKGTYVKKNDTRLTKIGQFLRKTSLDELPQFINVLKGEMSVVGPRPHMLSYTQEYSKVVDKYNFMFRHNVKPGITGLAQISGFRGEIKTEAEIINRIKYDNFYIENWSLLLDIKIIIQTIINMFKGEKKAY